MEYTKDYMIVRKCSDNSFILGVDQRLYSREATMSAAYKFSDRFNILMKTSISDPNYIDVIFESKDKINASIETVDDFANELLEQQIRQDVEKRFGNLRDEIVKAAFQPISL